MNQHEHSHEGHEQHGGHGQMGQRGVARPMARQQMHQQHQEHGGHHMSDEQRLEMLHMHQDATLWCWWAIVALGVWTMAAPVTFGYLNESLWVDPSGGRGVWFSDQTFTALRAQLMLWSDIAAGALLVIFGWRSLTPNRPVSQWVCCFLGIYLTFAPLVFWAPTAASYLNDTIVGALVIALSILIPGMPNMIMYMQHGPPRPPGWSYNPSSWPQRWIMIVLGFAGWLVSRYLAAFQLGFIDRAWDPFFGESTRLVLNSNMSHMWPISDGGLGALSYTFEFLMGFMGSPARWRTMPWMVAFFGILVIPLGLVHIILVISQPVVVGHWCTLCLLAAGIMLPMIPLEVDEVVAMCQHMVQARRRGDRGGSLWRIFWKGGSSEGCEPDDRTTPLMQLPEHPVKVLAASVWGMSLPWTLLLTAALGVWLMAAPTVLDTTPGSLAADADHLVGALIVVVSVIAWGEVVRAGRYLNVLAGVGLAIATWFVGGHTLAAQISDTVCGLLVAALSIPRGPKRETYGRWDAYVW